MNLMTGFCGKLPTHGDFVQRHVAADFALIWDHWLEQVLHAMHGMSGQNLIDTRASLPCWRFAFAGGACGESACVGVMVPSVDRVGREFPLTAVRRIDSDPLQVACGAPAWFDALEETLSRARQGEFDTLDDFDRALQNNVPPPPQSHGFDAESTVHLHGTAGLAAWAGAIAHRHLAASHRMPLAYWWTADEDSTILRWSTGLPEARQFAQWLNRSVAVPEANAATAVWTIPEEPFDPSSERTESRLRINLQDHGEAEHTQGDPLALFGDRGAAPAAPSFQSACISDPGKRRKSNQDACLEAPSQQLWAVADGMGGWADGDRASRLVIDALASLPPAPTLEAQIDTVRRELADTNRRLRTPASAEAHDYVESGSTVVVLLADRWRLAVIWAGDSRAYRLRDGHLVQLTRDHSLQAEMAVHGLAGDAERIPSNIITRAIGGSDELELEVLLEDIQPGDRYLLCSDGLYRELTTAELASSMAPDMSAREACLQLCKKVLTGAAEDNLSAVVVIAGKSDG